jgi:serine/threonine protein phosphatase 1
MGLIAIGDIHGCAATMEALLDELAPTTADHLVFIGDYVDRGPDSRGVLDRLVRLGADAAAGRGPACTFLRGNHDQMMLDYIDSRGANLPLWRMNGGLSTIAAYVDRAGQLDVPDDHLEFLRATELAFDTEDFVFVHAGLDPDITVAENLAESDPAIMLWTREHLDAELFLWEKTVVCGHTPMARPINSPRLIAIDTGAVYVNVRGLGLLTAVRLPEREFVQVPNQE